MNERIITDPIEILDIAINKLYEKEVIDKTAYGMMISCVTQLSDLGSNFKIAIEALVKIDDWWIESIKDAHDMREYATGILAKLQGDQP